MFFFEATDLSESIGGHQRVSHVQFLRESRFTVRFTVREVLNGLKGEVRSVTRAFPKTD